MAHLLPSNIQLVGGSGHFYTIVTVDNDTNVNDLISSAPVTDDGRVQDGKVSTTNTSTEDILVCGRCKSQFSEIEDFLAHKRQCSDSEKTYRNDENDEKTNSSNAEPVLLSV